RADQESQRRHHEYVAGGHARHAVDLREVRDAPESEEGHEGAVYRGAQEEDGPGARVGGDALDRRERLAKQRRGSTWPVGDPGEAQVLGPVADEDVAGHGE